jgi:hypothetical protein
VWSIINNYGCVEKPGTRINSKVLLKVITNLLKMVTKVCRFYRIGLNKKPSWSTELEVEMEKLGERG